MAVDFDPSARDAFLAALQAVLADIPGIRHVVRDDLTEKNLADSQVPGIVIDEVSTAYAQHNDHASRQWSVDPVVILDLQARARKTAASPHGDVSKARDLMVRAVINALIHNPRLVVQLDGEDAPTAHAATVLGGGFQVRYVKAPHPWARALITFSARLIERFDDRATEPWTAYVLHGSPDPEADAADYAESAHDLPDPGIITIPTE